LTSAWSGHWAPLTWLTLAADFRLWGMAPFGYHLTSLLLHAAAAAVFFFVAARLLARAQPQAAEGAIQAGAVAAALAFAAYPLRRLTGHWRKRVLEKVPYVVIAGAGAVAAAKLVAEIKTLAEYPLWVRPAVFGHNLVFYLEKTVLPQGLSPLYELPARWALGDGRLLLGLILPIVLTLIVLAMRHRWPAPLAVWVAYVITLLPVGGLAIQAGPQLAADRYTYLACMGLALLGGGACALALGPAALTPRLRGLVAATAVVVLLGLAALSWQHAAIWHDSVALWTHATGVDPACAKCQNRL